METKQNIEDQINAALGSAKKIAPSDLPPGFSERVSGKLHSQNKVRMLYTFAPLLRVAAVALLIITNVYTLRLAMDAQPTKQTAPSYVSLKDFVNEYQINDANEEFVTNNTPNHEQP